MTINTSQILEYPWRSPQWRWWEDRVRRWDDRPSADKRWEAWAVAGTAAELAYVARFQPQIPAGHPGTDFWHGTTDLEPGEYGRELHAQVQAERGPAVAVFAAVWEAFPYRRYDGRSNQIGDPHHVITIVSPGDDPDTAMLVWQRMVFARTVGERLAVAVRMWRADPARWTIGDLAELSSLPADTIRVALFEDGIDHRVSGRRETTQLPPGP